MMGIVQQIIVATALHELLRGADESTRVGVVVFLAFAHMRELGRLDLSDRVDVEIVEPRREPAT